MKPYIPPEKRAEIVRENTQVYDAKREADQRERDRAHREAIAGQKEILAKQLSALGQIADDGLVDLSWFEVTDKDAKPARSKRKRAEQTFNSHGLVTSVKPGILRTTKPYGSMYNFLSIDGEYWKLYTVDSELGVIIVPTIGYDLLNGEREWAHIGDVVEGPENEGRGWWHYRPRISAMITDWVNNTGGGTDAMLAFHELTKIETEQPAQP